MTSRLLGRRRHRQPDPAEAEAGDVTGALVPKRSGTWQQPPSWALKIMRSKGPRRLITLIGALLCLAMIIAVSGVRVARGSAGTVGVVRNGGPIDARTIRQVIMPGQSITYTGMFSQSPHVYPAAHVPLKYTVASQASPRPQAAVDTIALPTEDGVQVGLDAAVFFRFVGDANIRDLMRFDKSLGTLQFTTPDGDRLYPWNGAVGFNAMLDAVFRPVLENALRKEIGRFPCAALVSSCSLVHGSPGERDETSPNESIAGIEARINESLEEDLAEALGVRYFWDIRFRVGRITLPVSVQEEVDDAEAQFTAVNSARAQLEQARYLAERNRLLGKSYNASAGLTTIEALKAIPPGSTVIFSSGGQVPKILAGAGSGVGSGPPAAAGDSTPAEPEDTSGSEGESAAGAGKPGEAADGAGR